MQLAIVLTKVSLLRGSQSIGGFFFVFFFFNNDSKSKTYKVDINIRYFHWRLTFSLFSFHISVQG